MIKKAKHHALKRWRFEYGLSIQKAAKMFGITQGYLSEIENWKKEPSLSLAATIVDIVHDTHGVIALDDFVLRKRHPPSEQET